MNRNIISTMALGLALVSIATSVQTADASKWGINQRQQRQQRRISNGISSGELTAKEAAKIQQRQAKLAAKEAQMRASGGKFTARERLKLQTGMNVNSQQIYNQKHDAQDR